ncbi:hypothetical protein CYMTET_20540 [Cymbomonas tetramitiformis]|uniref:Uncharacterized protein n=1 Tax=Cymbomonas tetramitiformis TaxID=36881 RepID=A0AAE0G573_9CHLO|nr:hypothetical protein CYMTET_20540 [Cymbomonas tetramitiformis]
MLDHADDFDVYIDGMQKRTDASALITEHRVGHSDRRVQIALHYRYEKDIPTRLSRLVIRTPCEQWRVQLSADVNTFLQDEAPRAVERLRDSFHPMNKASMALRLSDWVAYGRLTCETYSSLNFCAGMIPIYVGATNVETDVGFAAMTEECGTRLADLRAVEVVAEAVCESLKLAWLRFYEIADRTYVYTDPDARTIMVSEDPDVADGIDAFRRYDVRFGEVTPLSLVPLSQYKRFLNLDEDVTALEMANCWIVTVFADACNTKGREHLRGLYEHAKRCLSERVRSSLSFLDGLATTPTDAKTCAIDDYARSPRPKSRKAAYSNVDVCSVKRKLAYE